ncbi:MAG: IS110 family transposase [Dermatophilaceae bacterium]
MAVPIDVGKHKAMAKVVDFTGAELAKPFEFPLDRSGVKALVERVRGTMPASVSLVRVGLEAAGHYHLPLAGGVLPVDWELRVLNPGHVSMQRKVNGQRGVKTDKIDLAAITDLLLAGRGVIAPPFADPIMTLTGWVAHRRRRSLLRRRTIQQLTTHVDRCFPGLGATMWSVVLSKAGRLVISELADPIRVARLGPSRLRSFAAKRGVRMTTPLAEKIVEAARQALPVPGAEVSRRLLASDLRLLTDVEEQIALADLEIEALLPQTPFGVLTSTPGWGSVRVANYGAAVGDPERWPGHRQLYRAAGLTPRLYESAGRRADGHITREGSVLLRVALVDLGTGLWHSETISRAYGAELRARGKPGGIIITAMAHRANKIAFAMVRDHKTWEPSRWAA